MDTELSFCGLKCHTCPILAATKENDDEKKHQMRTEIARQIKEHYGRDCTAEDVADCDGCKSQTGRLFSGCNGCKIRQCAKEKQIDNCAHCSEYACEKLEKFFATDAGAKTALDEIRKNL